MKSYIVLIFAAAAAMSAGQSFNVDIDYPTDPELGGGVPSSSFGAAAFQSGVWNNRSAMENAPQILFDLNGASTSVTFTSLSHSSATAWNNPGMTGNYAALMNDVLDVNGSAQLQFRNLIPGSYEVFTYCGKSFPGNSGLCDVTIGDVTKRIEGVLPNNTFVEGLTHSRHFTIVGNDGALFVQLSGSLNHAFLSGIQVVSVPEPATLTILGAASAALLRMRRKRR